MIDHPKTNETSKNILSNQKGTAFFGMVIAMLLFTSMGIATISIMSNDLSASTGNLSGSQSFYVAEGGMQYIVMNRFHGDSDFSDNVSPTDPPFGATSITFGGGEFWVEYENQSNIYTDVKITARVGTSTRVLVQTVTVDYDYMTIAEGNFAMNGTTGDIYGNVSINGSTNIDPLVTVHDTVDVGQSQTIPAVDFSVYKNMTTATHSGNKTFSSDYTGNLYVTGDVQFDDDVTFTGVLYADGDIVIKGDNVTVNGTLVSETNINGNGWTNLSLNSQEQSTTVQMPAMIAGGKITFNNSSTLTIKGVVWSAGNFNANNVSNTTVTGTFLGGRDFTFNNSSSVSLTFDADYLPGLPGFASLPVDANSPVAMSNWKSQ